MINVALIGCGYWGSKLRRYLDANPHLNLMYICDSESDLDMLVWGDESINAVVIAAPNDTHYSLTKMALLNGKHVLVEKPLAMTVAECEELKRLAINHSLTLLTDYTWTFSKGLQRAQQLVQDGEIGEVVGIELVARQLGRFDSDDVYWLLGSHMLAVLDMFIPISDIWLGVTGLVYCDRGCETGVITSRCSDVSTHITISLNYPGKETRVMLYGEKGTIVYDAMCQPSLRVEKYKRAAGARSRSIQMPYHTDESNNLRYVVEYFHKAIKGEVDSNVDRAIAVTRVLRTLDE